MSTVETRQQKFCKGPRHRDAENRGKWLPIDSFAPRSRWCRLCMRDYDKQRGSVRLHGHKPR